MSGWPAGVFGPGTLRALPTYRTTSDGGAVNATAAQSEVVAIDDHRLLVLSRDGNGLGQALTNPSVYKSVLLVDLAVGAPSNIAGTARDAAGGKITTTFGTLDPTITPLSWVEAINMLNTTQLGKFNINLDAGGASQVDTLTLSEKWEGMSLVPDLATADPNDFFLFVANDNDFLTSQGMRILSDGSLVPYNAFAAHPANRIPAPVGAATANESDTLFLVYRVSVPEPSTALVVAAATGLLALRRRPRRA